MDMLHDMNELINFRDDLKLRKIQKYTYICVDA